LLTASEILEEYGKCILDPTYPIETFFRTFDKTQNGFVPFKLFPKQIEIIGDYEKYRMNLVAKPRQAGISTTTAAFLAVRTGFADKENPEAILIVANKQDMAFEFLGKVKDFINQLPRWVWGSEYYGTPEKEKRKLYDTESKKEIKLPNGSRIKAVATSKDALRGYTPTYLIMDEAAFIDNGKELFGAALTALGTGGRATLISTPNGQDPLYYETYENSQLGENDFNVIEMRWYQDLRYNKDLKWWKWSDENKTSKIVIVETKFTFESYDEMVKDGFKPTSSWYEEMCRAMNNDKRMIAQELDVSFLGSGGNVVDEEYIEYHKTVNVMEPAFLDGKDNVTWIWQKPIEDHEYILSSDVSRGDGDDWSTFTIIDFTTMEQVVEYRGKVPPDKLAIVLDEYGRLYGNALLIVDITGGMGITTTLKLQEMKYPNLYYEERTKALRKRKEEGKYHEKNETPGFQVGADRSRLVAQFEKMVRINSDEGADKGIKIRSSRLITEMNTFIYKNGRPDHATGKHDDLIMAMAMALFVMEFSFKKLKAFKAKTKNMLGSWVMNSADPVDLDVLSGNGFVPRGKKKDTGKPPTFNRNISRNMQDPEGKYLWLFSGTR